MNYIAKLKAIKRIMDALFTEETRLDSIEIIKCDEHDGIIYAAKVYDHEYDITVRLDRNADGTYAMTQYCY